MSAKTVLFLCPDNAARSLMAEAYTNHAGRGLYEAYSAGHTPAREFDPVAIEVLREAGLRIGAPAPKSVELFAAAGAPRFDLVVSLGDEAAPVPPRLAGAPRMLTWLFAAQPLMGTVQQRKAALIELFAEIRRQIDAFLICPRTTARLGDTARGEIVLCE